MAEDNTEINYSSYDEYPVFAGEWVEMSYTPECTQFMVWAPTADAVQLSLYDEGLESPAVYETEMRLNECGQWKVSISEDLNGKFYTFNVHSGGRWLGETPGVAARAVGANGLRGAVVDLKDTDPEDWNKDCRPELKSFADIIIYEMHHRDFSIHMNSGMHYKGKFLALTERNTKSLYGQATGLAHLKELGITHIHMLPSFDYATVDETKPDVPQYNWGYDPLNYNVPEGSYATDAACPTTRIREFKQMVQTLHKEGIRVIMDVVFNHTYYNEQSNFEKTVPGYFYRHQPDGSWSNGSGCNNETASERAMMRKFMVESVCYWAKEYHVDGFRFDLMGLHDIETMNIIRAALDEIDPTIFMYGEGWTGCAPAYPGELLALKANTWRMKRIACFSDEFREGLRRFCVNDGEGMSTVDRIRSAADMKFGIAGGLPHPQLKDRVEYYPQTWATAPTQMISYVSCHDDYCIGDHLKLAAMRSTTTERCRMLKLIETALFTSQGIPFLFAGDEIMRDKKEVRNTYCSPDNINRIDWRLKQEYMEIFTYVSDLIALRKAHPALHMGDVDSVYRHLDFLSCEEGVVAFQIKGRPEGETWNDITVILNSHRRLTEVSVPEGEYRVVCYDGYINPNFGLSTKKSNLLSAEGLSATIAYRKIE